MDKKEKIFKPKKINVHKLDEYMKSNNYLKDAMVRMSRILNDDKL